MKICIIGMGYVGLSLSTLLSRKNEVVAVDVIKEKVDLVNNGKSPLVDNEISEALASGNLELKATLDINECKGAEYVIIATPTNYDPDTDSFDTRSVDSVIEQVTELNPQCTIVIKSTIPIHYTKEKYNAGHTNIIFSPEFLREGRALYDNLHPSRIIVGIPSEELRQAAEKFGHALANASEKADVVVLVMGSSEAESVKLFSNTYLAMRVAFFNELDTYAEAYNLDSKMIICGVSMDPRIGDYYNNPSFGYGGYCLPKDTKELLSNFAGIPNSLIRAIVESNDVRKHAIVKNIELKAKGGTVGIYRIAMKSGSDNYRESAILNIANLLMADDVNVIMYEPTLKKEINGISLIADLDEFVSKSDVVITNRVDQKISKAAEGKIYSRDLFSRD